MTTQLLASELTNLVQESKRKHNDLRQVSTLLSLLLTGPVHLLVLCRLHLLPN